MYKCHIGSCTPRRTIMESKKKKNKKKQQERVPLNQLPAPPIPSLREVPLPGPPVSFPHVLQ